MVNGKCKNLRRKGNKLLHGVEQLLPGQRASRLRDAERFLTRAMQEAAGDEEIAACHKQLAACHLQVAYLEHDVRGSQKEACSAVCRAVKEHSVALEVGQPCMPQAWADDVVEQRTGALSWCRSMLVNGWDHGALLSFYHKVLEETSQACSGYQKAWVAFHAAQSLFQTGATCLEIEDPRGGLRFFAAAQSSLIITQQMLCEDYEELEEYCEELQELLHSHECIARSAQELGNAEALVRKLLQDSEDLDMDALWQAADMYKAAIVLTRDNDIADEAKACSKLGCFYMFIMGDKERAVPQFRTCLKLAHSLVPVPQDATWFKEARDALQREQKRVRNRVDEQWQEDKADILQALKPELAACNKAAKGGFKKLLLHVYAHHPPRVPRFEVPDCSAENWKVALQTALRHYHTDSFSVVTSEDDHWFVLCEEVTKLINAVYSKIR